MAGKIDMNALINSGKFQYYRHLFEKINAERAAASGRLSPLQINETHDAFINVSSDPSKGHIFLVQTQGFLPTHYDGGVQSGIDTGGQTFYVLNTAKALANLGYKVTVLGQRYGNLGPYLLWFQDPGGGMVEIVRVIPGGLKLDAAGHTVVGASLTPKEELYPKFRGMAEDAAIIGFLRGAYGYVGGYTDGNIIGVSAAQALDVGSIAITHSMGQKKALNENFKLDDPFTYFGTWFNFGIRKQAEIAAILSASRVIANAPDEAAAYRELYGVDDP
nr:glycosyltransferase [bacterium]